MWACARAGWSADRPTQSILQMDPVAFSPDDDQGHCVWSAKTIDHKRSSSQKQNRERLHVGEDDRRKLRRVGVARRKGSEQERMTERQ